MNEKTSRGIVFSIDAFIATTIVILLLFALMSFIAVPKPPVYSLNTLHVTAEDTLETLDTMKVKEVNSRILGSLGEEVGVIADASVLEQLLIFMKQGRSTQAKVLAEFFLGNKTDKGAIPEQYNYVLEYYDGTGWREIASRKEDLSRGETLLATATKVKVITNIMYMGKEKRDETVVRIGDGKAQTVFNPGESPYCYITCRSFDMHTSDVGNVFTGCLTPCDRKTAKTYLGLENTRPVLVRLTVYV